MIRAVPTEKRQRQKEGRQFRLAAKRKAEKRRQLIRRTVIVVIVAGVVVGSVLLFTQHSNPPKAAPTPQDKANAAAQVAGCPKAPATPAVPANKLHWTTPPATVIVHGASYVATVSTTQGTFAFKLNTTGAPINANNFVFLAQHNFYNCNTFWRVIPGFMDQTGDPTSAGTGGPGYAIKQDEYPKRATTGIQYPKGAVAIANSGPGTNGSQFFIVAKSATAAELPPKYTIIGQVISGMSAVETINNQGDPNASQDGTGSHPAVVNRILAVGIQHV